MANVSRSRHRALTALILAAVATSLWSSAAWACRGTAEYPELARQLAAASLTDERRAELTHELEAGHSLHERAHRDGDNAAMRESLRILDRIGRAL
jgi:hypothetical protein